MRGFRIGNVTIDCNDLEGMTAFWGGVAGFSPIAGDETFALLADDEHPGRLKLFMQKVPEPRVGKNRLHLDLYVEDSEAAMAEVERLGGRRVGEHARGEITWVIANDPEGNEFCLVEVLPRREG